MSPSMRLPKTCLLALCLAPLAALAQNDAESKARNQQLLEIRMRIQAVQQGIERDRGEQGGAQKQLEELERGIAAQQGRLRQLKADIAKQAKQVQKLEVEQAQAQQQMQAQKRALGRQLRAAYITGEREQTKLLLNQDRLVKLSRTLTYYDYLNHGRVRRIGELKSLEDRLQALLKQVADETQRLLGLKQEQEKSLLALEQSRMQRKGLLQEIAARIAEAAENLQTLRGGEQELLKLLEALRDSLADIPVDLGKGKKFAQLKGQLGWPLRGKLLAKYGEPKGVGKLRWDGMWIAAAEGSAVRAIARGRVAYTGWMRRYGLIAVLEHEGGYYSLYGHTQGVSAEAGEWVEAGQSIAAAGNTGGHEHSGLYFELRKGSAPVNPKDWLKK